MDDSKQERRIPDSILGVGPFTEEQEALIRLALFGKESLLKDYEKSCRNCGGPIEIMAFLGEDYCSDDCRKKLRGPDKRFWFGSPGIDGS